MNYYSEMIDKLASEIADDALMEKSASRRIDREAANAMRNSAKAGNMYGNEALKSLRDAAAKDSAAEMGRAMKLRGISEKMNPATAEELRINNRHVQDLLNGASAEYASTAKKRALDELKASARKTKRDGYIRKGENVLRSAKRTAKNVVNKNNLKKYGPYAAAAAALAGTGYGAYQLGKHNDEKAASEYICDLMEKEASYTSEDVAVRAGEMLIDSLIQKQAAFQTANEAMIIGAAAEKALNSIGYTGFDE